MLIDTWQPSSLEDLLEGVVVDDEVNRALKAIASVSPHHWEHIDEPRDEIEELVVDNDLEVRCVQDEWDDPARWLAVDKVELAVFIIKVLSSKYEERRLIITSWQTEDEHLLPHSLDEYVAQLRSLEVQIHRQADETCALAFEARLLMDEQIEQSFSLTA